MKQARAGYQPQPSKTPRLAADPESFYDRNPSWRVNRLEVREPYGWHILTDAKLHEIREKLTGFENSTWKDILVRAGDRNHFVEVSRLCPAAKKRLSDLRMGDIEELVSLRLSGKERIWGILNQGVMQLLWWDPDHEVCPSLLKHT